MKNTEKDKKKSFVSIPERILAEPGFGPVGLNPLIDRAATWVEENISVKRGKEKQKNSKK